MLVRGTEANVSRSPLLCVRPPLSAFPALLQGFLTIPQGTKATNQPGVAQKIWDVNREVPEPTFYYFSLFHGVKYHVLTWCSRLSQSNSDLF